MVRRRGARRLAPEVPSNEAELDRLFGRVAPVDDRQLLLERALGHPASFEGWCRIRVLARDARRLPVPARSIDLVTDGHALHLLGARSCSRGLDDLGDHQVHYARGNRPQRAPRTSLGGGRPSAGRFTTAS